MPLGRSVAFRHHRLAGPAGSGPALTRTAILVTRFASCSEIGLAVIQAIPDVVDLGGHADAHRITELTGPAVPAKDSGPVAEELATQCRSTRTA
jgi:hypothetical protein